MLTLQFLVPLLALATGLLYVVFGEKTYTDPYIRGIHHSLWVMLAVVSLIVALKYLSVISIVKSSLVRSGVVLSMPLIAAVGAAMVLIAGDSSAGPNAQRTRIAGHVWIAIHGLLVGLFLSLPPKELVRYLKKGR